MGCEAIKKPPKFSHKGGQGEERWGIKPPVEDYLLILLFFSSDLPPK